MKQQFTLLLAMAALASVSSCKKDKDEEPKAQTKTEMLLAKNWRVSAHTSQYGTDPVVDNYAAAKACERDNFYKFNADKTFNYDEGATKCSPGDPQTVTKNWDLTARDTKFVLHEIPYDVIEISPSTIRLNFSDEIFGEKYTLNVTMSSF